MKKRLFLTLLISTLALGTYAQNPANYLSNDWAFFELKGKVKAVKSTINNQYTEEHTFSRSGVLLGEDATGDDMWSDNPFGYTRDANGRIKGTGNGHYAWTWKGRTVIKEEYGHMGDESTSYYLYDQSGKRTGYKDEKGKVHKYTYMDYDARGNWTYRMDDNYYTERRKIYYY